MASSKVSNKPKLVRKKSVPAGVKRSKRLPVTLVAIGASAGGLEAVCELLENLPPDTGLAYIYVQHLSPDHESSLPLLLSRSTKMEVLEVSNLLRILPDHVYVCTPNKEIRVENGKIRLSQRKETLPYLPIDDFFISLAGGYDGTLIGIILSGNATDGSKGLKAILGAGGITFAQDNSSKYNSMPNSAIDEGGASFVLPPKEIAAELVHFAKMGVVGLVKRIDKNDAIADSDPSLNTIFTLLHKNSGVDFSHYKMSTIKRRIQRRIQKNNLKSIKEYVKLFKANDKEAELLYNDLLINVTSFFRDKEVFRHLKTRFFPKLLKEKKDNKILRIWVPACSSGEEVYSIAMQIVEIQEKLNIKIPVRIFASDLSEQVLNEARLGEYNANDVAPIPQPYLNRFFTKTNGNYRVVKELREMCVFVMHNVLRDPPFSRMDFVSCRNLLIYFDVAAQKKVMATLHFALNDSGYLLLGKSETIGTSSLLFTQLDISNNIYSRKKNSDQANFRDLEPRFIRNAISASPTVFHKQTTFDFAGKIKEEENNDLDTAINALLLANFTPACAVINKNMEIIQFRGNTSLFLSHSTGKASLNILKMVRPEFSFELRDAIRRVLKTKQQVTKEGIEVNIGSKIFLVKLIVELVNVKWDETLMLVVFKPEEHREIGKTLKGQKGNEAQKDRRIKKLTEELNTASAEMHEFILSQEQAYEELQAANEEIVSTNEEFQTLNEELESTKEEIEATNEELTSTNQELQMRNELLMESDSYSEAIISTLHEPMLVLNKKFEVKSASKSFCKKFNLEREEIEGKPFFQFGNRQWNIPELKERLEEIIAKNVKFENFEVTHSFPDKGEMTMMLNASRIVQKIHGEQLILLAIEDITDIKRKQSEDKEAFQQNIRNHKEEKLLLEKAVKRRTKQLEHKNEELQSVNKDLEAFNYVSSHDLQEPLRKIQNFTSLILRDKELQISKEGSAYLKKLQETSKRMRSLIEDLLLYSRTKSAERNFEKEKIYNIILDAKNEQREMITKKKAQIVIKADCEVNIIKFQFMQLFSNLISNSLKFSSPKRKPRITIECKVSKGSVLKFKKLSPDIKYCHIVFTDNGIGFDAKYRERIFEVFQRLHTLVEYEGTGIGLSICKRIVENHEGFMIASGEPDRGARFDIYIPAKLGEE
ncbi:MAG: domain S-box protein [Bacteroidota bacterium]|jgi:two-component system CheB/CheR fusion protein|nr:domain S-box protein [Bacteroidota bacterium]